MTLIASYTMTVGYGSQDGSDPTAYTLDASQPADVLQQIIRSCILWDRESDDPPAGQTSRRGWWADAYVDRPAHGSLIWRLRSDGLHDGSIEQIRDAAEEALGAIVEMGIATSVSAEAERYGASGVALSLTIERDESQDGLTYEYLWRDYR